MARPAVRFWSNNAHVLPRTGEKGNPRRPMRRPSLSVVILIVFCMTACTFMLAQLRGGSQDVHVAAGQGYEALRPSVLTPAEEVLIVIAPAINGAVVRRPDITPYSLSTLSGLLNSLADAVYPVRVTLRVMLAPERSDTAFEERYSAVSNAASRWTHGPVELVNATSGGLFELIVGAWNPPKGATERAVLVDAAFARILHRGWFRYVSAGRARYMGVSDVAAFAPRPHHVRVLSHITNRVSHWLPPPLNDAADDVYLYANAAYAPVWAPASADMWRSFQLWFAARRSEWFLWPSVAHPKDRQDPEWSGFSARARAHWSMWYTRFMAEHALYVVYPRREDAVAPGVEHLRDAPIAPLMRIAYDGSVVMRRQDDGGATDEELNEIVGMARQGDGSVALTIVTEAFLDTARSWACNVNIAGFKPKATVWIAPDETSYNALREINGTRAIHMRSFKGGRAHTGTHFNSPGYWLLMLERTRLIRDLLERGVGVFAFETDQIWLRDPVPAVERLVRSGDGVDLIGTLDTRNQIAGNFLYMAPTLASRRLWREVARRFENAYIAAGMHRHHTAKYERYIENDQSILTRLVFYDEAFKGHNGIVFRALDTDRFVDGRWYEGNKFYGASAQSPTMINNNFLVGIHPKIERAKQYGHWFWDGEKCDPNAVHNAIAKNELRAHDAEMAARSSSGADARPEQDYDVGIDKAMNGVAKSLKRS